MVNKVRRQIKNNSAVEETTGCWLWTASTTGMKNKLLYGKVTVGSKLNGTRKNSLAHRVSYEAFVGPIPEGKLVLHSCDNSLCVNPAHLFLGSHLDNMADAISKGRLRGGSSYNHPSQTAYRNGCRCAECRIIVNKYKRELYHRKKLLRVDE